MHHHQMAFYALHIKNAPHYPHTTDFEDWIFVVVMELQDQNAAISVKNWYRPPLSLLLALILVVAFLNTFWSNQLLEFCSTIVVSSYSNSYELVTVVAVVNL
ncbi:hypothetical protein ACTXT7_008916 [Hymenolepis weldensis]